MNPSRRSKAKHSKARLSNLKTVEVGRGRNGYGFTMTGQYPCVLSSILPGSPADIAALKSGDCVMAVNGESVARVGHAQIIKLIGSTSGVLRLTVAGPESESESSDEDYVPSSRMRYLRSKSVTPTANSRGEMDELERDEVNQDTFFEQQKPEYGNGDTQSHSKTPTDIDTASKFAPGHLSPYNRTGKSSVMLQKSATGYDYTYWNGREFEHIGGHQKPRRVKRHAENRQFRQRAYSAQSHATFYTEEEEEDDQGLRPLTPIEVSNISYPSLHSNTRRGSRHTRPVAAVKERQVLMHAVVGYLGSIDIPASANLPTASLQAIRGCVRRLHLEQRVHSLMLMEITNMGVELINANHRVTVVYPSERITFSGVCPDDKRCFGIVTAQNHEEVHNCVDSDEEPIGSSCHVFIVDPSLSFHNVHFQMAGRFGIQCIHDPATNTCQQFPTSSRPLLTHISLLHRDHGDSLHFADFYGQSLYQAGPRRSNSNSSNSDSGFGNGKENGTESNQHGERVLIVDVAGHIRNQRTRLIPENHTHNSTTTSPNRHVVHAEINTSQSSYSMSSTSPSSPEHSPQSTFNQSRFHDPSGRLTPRARPDPVLKDLNGCATPLARTTSAVLNASSGRLTPRARPDPVGFYTPLVMPMSQKNGKLVSKQHPQGVNIMVHPQYRPPNTAESSTAQNLTAVCDLNVPMRNRQSEATNVKGRPPTGRHSMYAKTDTTQRSQELMNPSKKEVKQKITQFQRLGVSRQHDLARRNSDCSEYSSSNLKTSMQRTRRTHPVQLQESGTTLPLAASDGELDTAEENLSLKSDGNRSNPNLLDIPSGQDIGRVSSWAVSFGRLLQDELGLACFTEFLKREFSEENIMFWIACETMSKMTKPAELKRMSEHIFSKHLADDASMPVNLDSSCRSKVLQALKSPTPEMYKFQQQQIFKLMKFDSYSRFLKSKVYQDCVLAEMAGNPLPVSFNRQRSDGSVSSTEGESKKSAQKGNKKKYHIWKTTKSYNLEVSEDNTDKKRKSMLPWNRVTRKFSKDPESPKATGNVRSIAVQPSGSGTNLFSKTKETLNGKSQSTKAVTPEGTCRLVFPNDDVVVLPARQGFSVRDVLAPHLDVRQLNLQAVETFLADSKDILDYNQDMGTMAGAEIVVERRVVFRMELPSHRVIGVKSKPNKKLIEVLRPVTHKYNLQLDALVVHLSNSPVPLDLDITVASLDGCKILIETLEQYGAGNYQARASVDTVNSAMVSAHPKLHKSASEESFVKKDNSKPTLTVQLQRRFSDSGSHAKDTANGNKSKSIPEVKGQPNSSDTCMSMQEMKSHNRKYRASNGDAEELYTMLSKAQRRRMDDQRGLTIRNLDLPDFLKKPVLETSGHRPKSALGTPYQCNKPEFVQSYEKTQRFQDMAVRCKSTPPTPYNNEMGFKEGVIPSLDQADAVFGSTGRSSDITPVIFNESMTAMTEGYHYDDSNLDISLYRSDSNSTSMIGSNTQTNFLDADKFSPHAFPTSRSINTTSDNDFRGRGYSLEIFDATLGDRSCAANHPEESCKHEDRSNECHGNSSGHQEYDLDQTITKSMSGHEVFLPPPPNGLDSTLRLEEANYSPPPPVLPTPKNHENIYTGDRNQLTLSMTRAGETIQGSTLPGHAADLSNQPLTDTDSVTFGDNPLADDLLLTRTPSPSTHDLVMTPHQEDDDALPGHCEPMFTFQQNCLPQRNMNIHTLGNASPDVLKSLNRMERDSASCSASSQYNTSQGASCSYVIPLPSTIHPAASHQSTIHNVSPDNDTSQLSISQPGTTTPSILQNNSSHNMSSVDRPSHADTTHHSTLQNGSVQSSVSHSVHSQGSTSSISGMVPKQGINLQWKVAAGVQQRIDDSKWETVVKDGRTMRATFV